MGGRDLVDAVGSGEVELSELDSEELPEELEGMSHDELRLYLEAKETRRAEIQERITDLSRQRDTYIAEQLADAGAEDSFDAQVLKMIRTQAAEKGITY
jgi:hypothetical protein